jgi:triosephosphate isomerase (TIM)
VADRTPLIAGNWKCNLNHLEAIALVQKLAFSLNEEDLESVEVAVLPPFTDIRSVQTLVDGDKLLIKYGAQDVSTHDSGAYTGEVSGAMLAKLGCTYVVIGHSERRQYHNETDAEVNLKVKAAFRHGLVPIMCVGEDHDTRREKAHVQHTLLQVEQGLHDIPAEQARTLVIAYEPIWAIGTGEVATPEDAQEMAVAIRSHIEELYDPDVAANVRILYGGSVKAANAGPIMAQPDVDGALVGNASLVAEEFVGICRFQTAAV